MLRKTYVHMHTCSCNAIAVKKNTHTVMRFQQKKK